ncbi:MAG: hypothetical protein ACPGKS_03220 [Coraliomargarita sp.]
MTEKPTPLYLLRFWYKPGTTMQALIAADKGHGVAVLVAAFFGVFQMGPIFARSGAEGFGPFALAGSVAGVTCLYFMALLARNFSRWFGGSAELRKVRIALGISLAPWTLVFAGLFVVLLGAADAESAAAVFPLFAVGFIYGWVIVLLSMSAALGITPLRTFGVLALTFVVAFFFISFVAQIVLTMTGHTVGPQ